MSRDMSNFFRKIYQFFLLVFHKEQVLYFSVDDQKIIAEAIINPPEPTPALEKAAENYKAQILELPKPKKKEESYGKAEDIGTFYYLGDILDTLDKYFETLKKFKNYDPDTYALYHKVGGLILSKNAMGELHELPATWRIGGKRPAFGLVHFKNENDGKDDSIFANLMYFRKYNRLWNVQPTNHDLYELCLFYNDKAKSKNCTFVGTMYVSVDSEGHIVPLKEKVGASIYVKPKMNRKKQWGSSSYRVQQWQYPEFLKNACEFYKEKHGKELSRDDMARELLCLVATFNEYSSAGLQVRASHGGLTAVFAVDMLRTPYFFKDRQKTVTVNGKTKKIFHIVRTHKRVLADGSEQNVKSHFRGERKFQWHKYDINVTMPGYHHGDLKEYTGSAYEYDESNPIAGMDSETTGNKIAQYMDRA